MVVYFHCLSVCLSVCLSAGSIVRLTEEVRQGLGRVEIHHDHQWGTICDDDWDLRDADVFCRMLNYSGAVSSLKEAPFGGGNGPIWMDRVSCLGNESSILDCGHDDWGNSYCSHYEDAGVVCQPNEVPNYGEEKFNDN